MILTNKPLSMHVVQNHFFIKKHSVFNEDTFNYFIQENLYCVSESMLNL
jgi:hypothetical protein